MNNLRELTLSGYESALLEGLEVAKASDAKAAASKAALMSKIESMMLFGGALVEEVTMDTQSLDTRLWWELKDMNGDGIDDDWQ